MGGPPGSPQHQALVARIEGLVGELREMEQRVKPWLPTGRVHAMSESRRGLQACLSSLRASGKVSGAELGKHFSKV